MINLELKSYQNENTVDVENIYNVSYFWNYRYCKTILYLFLIFLGEGQQKTMDSPSLENIVFAIFMQKAFEEQSVKKEFKTIQVFKQSIVEA